jgi:hypothetical protein
MDVECKTTYHDPDIPYIYFGIPLHPQHNFRGAVKIRLYQAFMLFANASFTKVTENGKTPAAPAFFRAELAGLVDYVISIGLSRARVFLLSRIKVCKNRFIRCAEDEVFGLDICRMESVLYDTVNSDALTSMNNASFGMQIVECNENVL